MQGWLKMHTHFSRVCDCIFWKKVESDFCLVIWILWHSFATCHQLRLSRTSFLLKHGAIFCILITSGEEWAFRARVAWRPHLSHTFKHQKEMPVVLPLLIYWVLWGLVAASLLSTLIWSFLWLFCVCQQGDKMTPEQSKLVLTQRFIWKLHLTSINFCTKTPVYLLQLQPRIFSRKWSSPVNLCPSSNLCVTISVSRAF